MRSIEDLWRDSDKHLREIIEVSNLPPAESSPSDQDPFDRMKGLLAEYSDDAVDSVELVNAVRGK